jgi:hypothetical protein
MNRCWPVSTSGVTALILTRLYLVQTRSLDRPTVPSNGSLIHTTLLSSQLLFFNLSGATRNWAVGSSDGALAFTKCTNSSDHCTDACYLGTISSSDGVLSFHFLLWFWPLKNILSSHFGMWYFASLGPRNVYKGMLNNMVSPIDHVVMNHQNHTRTNVLWGHVRYNLPLFGYLWQHKQSKHNFAKIDKIEPLHLLGCLPSSKPP